MKAGTIHTYTDALRRVHLVKLTTDAERTPWGDLVLAKIIDSVDDPKAPGKFVSLGESDLSARAVFDATAVIKAYVERVTAPPKRPRLTCERCSATLQEATILRMSLSATHCDDERACRSRSEMRR